MLKQYRYEGKTLEEAKNKALLELTMNANEVYMKTEFIEGKLFKSAKYIVDVITKQDVKQYIKEFIKTYAQLMNVAIDLEIKEQEGIYNLVLISDNNPILIGKDGKTLESLQLIMRQAILRQTEFPIKINIDIANYKNNKLKILEREVRKIAKEVQNTKIDASLDPMNSYERRFLHKMISEMDHLETESVGESKDRHIVIKYKED